MPTETILNGSCRQHDFGTPPEPALTAPHQAISRVCWFIAFLHVTFVQKNWTAQNFGVFCSALNCKSALETLLFLYFCTQNSGGKAAVLGHLWHKDCVLVAVCGGKAACLGK